MSDFVDKLRSAACRGCECDECLLMRASAAEIVRLREQLASAAWQPIETAPRDQYRRVCGTYPWTFGAALARAKQEVS